MTSLAAHLDAPPEWRDEADRARALLIIHIVAFATGVPARQLTAAGRADQATSEARHMAMYLAHVALSWPLSRVGGAFDRDRTTVAHACRRIEARRDDADFDQRLTELEACLVAAPPQAGGLV